MEKITKKQAAKRYENGEGVTFCPSKCSPSSFLAVRMYKKEDYLFENLINHFHYYNCSRVSGLVVHFYK